MYKFVFIALSCVTLASCITTIREEKEITEFQFDDSFTTIGSSDDESIDEQDSITWVN